MITNDAGNCSQAFHSAIVKVFLCPLSFASFLLLLMIFLAACSQQEQVDQTGTKSPAAKARWVGSEACAPCHTQIYNSFRQTGMGRSFARPEAAKLAALLETSYHVHEPKIDFYYSAHLRDGKLIMSEFQRENGRVVYQQERTAAYQVGSGNNTVSFLEDRNGYLFEMPLTWYAEKKL